MDTTAPDIQFDSQGVCNFCKHYDERIKSDLHIDEQGRADLERLVAAVKSSGRGRPYNCLIGVSGGADSTYVAYLVKKVYGLNPLAIHVDNGWNAELAVANIKATLSKLEIDLFTKVLDWNKFRDLQVSFLRSSVGNAEIPTDHAIVATLLHEANSRGIGYVITGSNLATEAIMPASWMDDATDWRLIRSVHRQFGTTNLQGYPRVSMMDLAYFTIFKGIKFFPILNYVPYIKSEVKKLLLEELDWRDYGGKHYESIFTRFFQTYILPVKFNIDKRKAHYSTMIAAGQMTREEALEQLKRPPDDPERIEEDKAYVIKKLGLSRAEFDSIMEASPKSAADYPNDAYWWNKFRGLVKFAKRRATKVR